MEQTIANNRPRTDKRTEEVQHIIDRMPVTFFSRAAMLLAFIIVAMLVMGWVVRYPDVVTGQLVVNSNYASLKLISNTYGQLKLRYRSMDTVQEGAYIAWIQNTADPDDVIAINRQLGVFDAGSTTAGLKKLLAALPAKASLGEVSSRYFSFVSSLQEVIAFKEDSLYNSQKQGIEAQLREQLHIIENSRQKQRLGDENLKVIQSFVKRDSSLYVDKVISQAEMERMMLNYFSAQSASQQLDNEVTSMRKEINSLGTHLHELSLQRQEKEKQLMINLLGLYHELKATIIAWEEKYVLKAPIAGKVQYLQFWTENQFVQSGTPIFSILPKEQNIIGQVLLPAIGSGKVHPGQEVIIKLDNYPFMEYGTIKGKVTNLSLITNTVKSDNGETESYLVLVELPEKLKTNYGEDLGFQFELKGSAEIITNDRRLIDRLFDNLRYFTKN
jgi:hypothetical protein